MTSLALKAASFRVRNLRARSPFRDGIVTLTHFPLVHLAIDVEDAAGRRSRGFAADNPPPACLDAGRTPRTGFDSWLDADRGDGREAGLRIEAGPVAVGSLDAPGYGVALDQDLDSMTQREDWSFDSLEALT